MKKAFRGIAVLMSLGILAGCAGNKELIRTASTGTNQKVFQELGENLQPAAPGYVDLRIYASLKTHHPVPTRPATFTAPRTTNDCQY